ncbi:Huntingtin middle-repeat [Trinorchestia longiramus]|nr:Huntingtin middle-repeat [Trinorchestia longiramus]
MTSNMEKVSRFLEALKASQGSCVDDSSAASPASGIGQTVLAFPSSTEQFFEQTAAVASTISQQGQTLLSKREPGLSKRERMTHCQVAVDAVLAAYSNKGRSSADSSTKTQDGGRLLSMTVETLLILVDDTQPDVRMTADEALNRIVRSVPAAQTAKVFVEQMKEKKTGSARVIRAALARFAVLAKQIRVQKGRAYMQTLVPLLCMFGQRPEESLQESLATATASICPALGHFASDNEIKLLLTAFQPNLSHKSNIIRRSAAQILVSICRHCRKPNLFMGLLVALLLKMLVPLSKSQYQVLGGLACLRLLAPELPLLCPPTCDDVTGSISPSTSRCFSVSVEQVLTVYQLAVHYTTSDHHNTATAGLELLRAVLQHAPGVFVTALVTPGGVPRCLLPPHPKSAGRDAPSAAGVGGDAALIGGSDDTASTGGVSVPSEATVEAALSAETTPRSPSYGSLGGMANTEEEPSLEPDTPTSGMVLLSQADLDEDGGAGGGDGVNGDDEDVICDVGSKELSPRVGAEFNEADAADVAAESTSLSSDLYASVEIGQLADEDEAVPVLLPSKGSEVPFQDLEGGTEEERPLDAAVLESEDTTFTATSSSEQTRACGGVESVCGDCVSGRALVRLLCCRFLLAGHSGSLLGERSVRVSAKVLALNCLSCLLSWLPEMLADTLHEQCPSHIEVLVQRVWDVTRYCRHSDPSVCAAAASLLGHYLRAAALNTVTHECAPPFHRGEEGKEDSTDAPGEVAGNGELNSGYLSFEDPNVGVEALLVLLKEVLMNKNAVAARGAVAGLKACVPSLLRWLEVPCVLRLLPALLSSARQSYWLFRVDMCELLSLLPLTHIDFLEASSSLSTAPTASSTVPCEGVAEALQQCEGRAPVGVEGSFSHLVVKEALVPLLADSDHRVRSAAVSAITRLVPELQLSGDLFQAHGCDVLLPGHLLLSFARCGTEELWSEVGGAAVTPPYDALLARCRQHRANAHYGGPSPLGPPNQPPHSGPLLQEMPSDSLERLKQEHNEDCLSRLVHLLTNTLFTSADKTLKAGCVQALCGLSQRYPPVLHLAAWSCLQPYGGGTVACYGLLQQLLAFTSDASFSADLPCHAALITLATALLAGVAVGSLEQHTVPPSKSSQFSVMGSAPLRRVCSGVLEHVCRVLAVYWHVLEEEPLAVRAAGGAAALLSAPTSALSDASSPLRRRPRKEGSEATGAAAATTKDTRQQVESDKDRKSRPETGNISQLPQYCKLYEVLCSAYNNYKMSVCVLSEQRLSCLLRAALSGLCSVLEVLHTPDLLPFLEHLLLCCTAATLLLPQHAVLTARQLVKCLFGSNIAAQWHNIYPEHRSAPPSSTAGNPATAANIYACAVQLPLQQFSAEVTLMRRPLNIRISSLSKDRSSPRPPQSVRPALSSYIRLFEPLVIKALNLYTVSSCVWLQRHVLELLVCLVHIRVNYCLLDSNQIFLRYVIKQLEHIEEGQLRHAEVLVPALFSFLVSVSCERQRSGTQISLHNIIQLSDGLMASGQTPLSTCALALGPLVQCLFTSEGPTAQQRLQQSGAPESLTSAEAAELATKREVLSCTLIRLAQHHQVLPLLTVMVQSARRQSEQKWMSVSREVSAAVLPLLGQQLIDLHCQDAVGALLSLLCSLAPAVFAPPDELLKALLSSPLTLESTQTVEVWVAGVVVVLRVLVTLCAPSIIMSRLTELGLSMHYLSEDVPSSPSPPAAPPTHPSSPSPYSPARRKLATKLLPGSGSPSRVPAVAVPAQGDPLHATQPPLQPSTALARSLSPLRPGIECVLRQWLLVLVANTNVCRFVVEVLRVCCSELRSVCYLQCQEGGGTPSEGGSDVGLEALQKTPREQFLVVLARELLLLLLWMHQQEEWKCVASEVRTLSSCGALDEVYECLLSVRAQHASLCMLCCQLCAVLHLPGRHLWPHVLRSLQRGASPSASPTYSPGTRRWGPSACLSLQLLRRCAVLHFASFVVEHVMEEEWLGWMLVQHVEEVVALHEETSMQQLLRVVHASSAASALLLHALNTRGSPRLLTASDGAALVSVLSGVHASQSGTLVLVLLQEVLCKPHFLHIAPSVCSLLCHRLHFLLLQTPVEGSLLHGQLAVHHLAPYTHGHLAAVVSSRSTTVSGLLREVERRLQSDTAPSDVRPAEHSRAESRTVDSALCLRLIKKRTPSHVLQLLDQSLVAPLPRCGRWSGGSAEERCSLLLSLEAAELSEVMQEETFDCRLLEHAVMYGLHATLRACESNEKNKSSAASNNSSPNSNRSNSSNTSSVSSGSTTSSNSSGEHPFYSTACAALMDKVCSLVALLPKPHPDYRPGGGNKYSDRMNQLLLEGCHQGYHLSELVTVLAPAVTYQLRSLQLLPWRSQIKTHYITPLLRFALVLAELLQLKMQTGGASVWETCSSVACMDAVLRSTTLSQRLGQPEYTAYLCSLTGAVHAATAALIAPAPLPTLAASVWESLESTSSSVGLTAARLMQLLLWHERDLCSSALPEALRPHLRSVITGLCRVSSVNGVVRCPPDLWATGWQPVLSSLSCMPALPPHLLQEPDALKQFIFRAQLLGWLNRQQFEETWMALLSVLNLGSGVDATEQEQPYRDQSVCVCLRGLTGLLAQTQLLPTPGNPHTATNAPSPPLKPITRSVELRRAVRVLERGCSLVGADHLPRRAEAALQHYSSLNMAVFAAAAAVDSAQYGDDQGADVTAQSALLSAMGIDLASCTHFLHDLFSAWLAPGRSVCSSVLCEMSRCLVVLVPLLTTADHLVWVTNTCVALYTAHPHEDHTTHNYLGIAAARAVAVCRAANLGDTGASEGVLRMLESGLLSANAAVRTGAAYAAAYVLQRPPHRLLSLPPSPAAPFPPSVHPTDSPKAETGAMRLLQGTQLPRHAFNALTSQFKGSVVLGQEIKPVTESLPAAAAPPQDVFLSATVQAAASFVVKALDSRSYEGESHSDAVWQLCLSLLEQYSDQLHSSLPSTALHVALSTAAANSTTPALLRSVLASVERMLQCPLPSLTASSTTEVALKLVIDLVQLGPPSVSQAAVPLLLALLYANRDSSLEAENEEPERLLLLMERLGGVFERIRTGYKYESWLLAALLPVCLLDLQPPSQVLNKVIMEYISPQQPHPHLLAQTLFQVFEACMEESGDALVQEWVLMSLGNFTRREPVSVAVWFITCFLVAASRDIRLRSLFPNVLAWPAQLEQMQQYNGAYLQVQARDSSFQLAQRDGSSSSMPGSATQQAGIQQSSNAATLDQDQLEVFCLAAAQFHSALPSQHHRIKFREVFSDVATADADSPFRQMLRFLDTRTTSMPP